MLTYKYRLLPTKAQHRALENILEQQRQLYNAALAERIDAYKKTGKSISLADQSRSLTVIRSDDVEFSSVQRRIQKETLRRLDRAYAAFFRRVKAGETAGFPRFKGHEFFNSFGFDAFQQIKWDGKRLRFAGMPGGLRVMLDRPIAGEIKNVWFKREGRRWFVGFQADAPDSPIRSGAKTIGIDLGINTLAMLSNGVAIPNPRLTKRSERKIKQLNRALSRCQRHSNRRKKIKAQLAAEHRRTQYRRINHAHKQTAIIARQFGEIAVEKLNVKNLARGRLAKSVADAAWGRFRQMLEYKTRRHGGRVVEVDPRYTSQECHACGTIVPKTLAQRTHRCDCGAVLDRDLNAAMVISGRAFNVGGPTGGNVNVGR